MVPRAGEEHGSRLRMIPFAREPDGKGSLVAEPLRQAISELGIDMLNDDDGAENRRATSRSTFTSKRRFPGGSADGDQGRATVVDDGDPHGDVCKVTAAGQEFSFQFAHRERIVHGEDTLHARGQLFTGLAFKQADRSQFFRRPENVVHIHNQHRRTVLHQGPGADVFIFPRRKSRGWTTSSRSLKRRSTTKAVTGRAVAEDHLWKHTSSNHCG